MKKAIKLSILLIVSILLTSCGYSFNKFYPALSELGIYKSDKDRIKDKFEELITAIDEENSETICSLFSESTKNYVGDSFEDSVNELIQYCEGDLQSWEMQPAVYTEGSADHRYIQIAASFDVFTTEHKFRFYMEWIESERETPSKVGIDRLYLIRAEDDDTDHKYRYFGAVESKRTPGIHVGVKNHSKNP